MNLSILFVTTPIVLFVALAILSQWEELGETYGMSPIERVFRSIAVLPLPEDNGIYWHASVKKAIAYACRIPPELLDEANEKPKER